MRDGMCLNALYMILLKCGIYVPECASNDIIKMRPSMWQIAIFFNIQVTAGMCLKGLYRILINWEMYVSEWALYDIKMRARMCLNALYMILLIWECLCF